MIGWTWLLAASLLLQSLGQSLGEVAEREKKRRERNAEAGVESTSYTLVGGTLAREDPETTESEEEEESKSATDEGEAEVSPLEEARERGKILEPRMAEISVGADRVDRLYRRYMDECYGRYAIGATPPGIGIPAHPPPPGHVPSGRDWFLLPQTWGGSFVLVEPPRCESLRKELVASAEEVKRAMRELLDFARQERILPGVVRELREKYRLEWSGWER